MNAHNKRLAHRLARMAFDLNWAEGAARAAHQWALAGEQGSPEFAVCFRQALARARAAVREAEAIERTLNSAKGGQP